MPTKSSPPISFLLAIFAASFAALAIGAADRPATGQAPSEFRRPSYLDNGTPELGHDVVWSLGRKLFFDPHLSASETLACASCHQPDLAWTDRLPKAVGEAHRPLAFRAPSLLNAGQIERYGWTGRFPDVETTAFFAMGSPANMNLPQPKLLEKLRADGGYVADFDLAFPGRGISKQNVGIAIDRFVRSIASDVAPFDRWAAGDPNAIGPDAIRGFAIFTGKGKCAECHSGWPFTDGSFHDVGTATGTDLGRGTLFRTSAKLKYAFKTPTLRDVAVRSPYMHDGSIKTLEAVIDHYDEGGIDRPSRAIAPLGLSKREKHDLIAFLNTLTGGTKFAIKTDGPSD